ncbi:hypothetical protein HPB50_013468 [Hyalomma asiaticum]|uniref:Uncharacterized protein n=1 Tax=Hyalomma asiaticum TaxID=266040 RepID=A0ACB7S7C7_HYAAI|nr:hypothetical protein HPB50_013468 [Hyalomma asiaticum]
MRVVCYATHSSVVAEVRYRSIKKQTAQTTEFLWQRLHLQLPRRPKSRRSVGILDVLDDLQVPEEVPDGLKKGPKFSVQPRIPAHELLSLNRRVSRKAQWEDQQRCLLDGVDFLVRSAPKVHPRRDHIKSVENYLKEQDLRLLVSHKQGGFVVMTSCTFDVKAAQALDKNFSQVKKAALRPSLTMAVPTEDLPPGFTLSSTTGRSRAYDLLLREAGRILNCQPNRVQLSPRHRTRRTKRHTPVRPTRRARQANVTTSQPAVPFPSTASSQGPSPCPTRHCSQPRKPRRPSCAPLCRHLETSVTGMRGSTWRRAAFQKVTRNRFMPPISPPPHGSTPPLPYLSPPRPRHQMTTAVS